MIATQNYQSNPVYFSGRGSQVNPFNHYNTYQYVKEYTEVIDEFIPENEKTEITYSYPKSLINKVNSPDVPMDYSANPYQGCEHGCVYCYARNTHEYLGYSAGLDFENKIVVKKNAAELLEKELTAKTWKVAPVMLSGNTDCYQPIERKMELTRSMLKVFLKLKHPVGIITKNALILRDLDILKELAKLNLVYVIISVTGADEKVRQILEPRTSTYRNRLKTIQTLNENGVPCGVMFAPVIPGINNQDVPEVLRLAGLAGARSASYTMVRLNGSVGAVFKDWLEKNFPHRAERVWKMICETHDGNVSDSRFGVRMRGSGKYAEMTAQIFAICKNRYIINKSEFTFNKELFAKPKSVKTENKIQQMALF
ncbi:MAG: PA0069 family radical SAM protein [Bacteroidia bacterium]